MTVCVDDFYSILKPAVDRIAASEDTCAEALKAVAKTALKDILDLIERHRVDDETIATLMGIIKESFPNGEVTGTETEPDGLFTVHLKVRPNGSDEEERVHDTVQKYHNYVRLLVASNIPPDKRGSIHLSYSIE